MINRITMPLYLVKRFFNVSAARNLSLLPLPIQVLSINIIDVTNSVI